MLTTIISAIVALLGTVVTLWLKTRKPAVDQAIDTTAQEANRTTQASAAVTTATRATVQERTDANAKDTAGLVAAVGNADSLRDGADALNAAITRIDRSSN